MPKPDEEKAQLNLLECRDLDIHQGAVHIFLLVCSYSVDTGSGNQRKACCALVLAAILLRRRNAIFQRLMRTTFI